MAIYNCTHAFTHTHLSHAPVLKNTALIYMKGV